MATTHYIQSYYDGSLFEYSKEAKEDFVESTNSKGTVSYRKYYNKGVDGQLLNVNRKKNANLNNREELEIVLQNGEDKFVVTFPVLNNGGDEIDDFMESIVRVMPNLQKGETYNVNNWRMNKGDIVNGEEVKYNNSGVTFKSGDTKVEAALSYQTDNNPKGDIPKVDWKEKAGKNRPTAVSKEAKLDFLYGVFEKESERLAFGSNSSNQAQSQKPVEQAKHEKSFASDDSDDLPF